MPYKIQTITTILNANRIGDTPATIKSLLTDSRSLGFADQTLFFALSSSRNSGQRYVFTLYQKGVRNFVVQELPSDISSYLDCNFLVVPNSLAALQSLVITHRKQFQIPIIGITGSNGKTIVKEWLNQLLNTTYTITRSPRSYNSQIGVPLSVWKLTPQTTLGIFEAGISQAGEMELLQPLIAPTIGVFTTIGEAHQENFQSLTDKCLAKLILFKNCDVLIYNVDQPFVLHSIKRSGFKGTQIGWSRIASDQPLFIEQVEKYTHYSVIHYCFKQLTGAYIIPFSDEASIENSIHCLAVCLYLKLSTDQITTLMGELEPVEMRLEVKEGKNGCMLINDSYNSDLNSLDIALNFLYRRSIDKGLNRTLILSDLQQTGQAPEALYQRVAELIKSRKIDKLIGVGHELTRFKTLFEVESHFYPSTQTFIHSELIHELKNQFILLKGARSFAFEELTELLEFKVHETILSVNLNALVDNFNLFRAALKPTTQTICMVKAAAYGAGGYEVAKTLQDNGTNYLAVAVVDEGVELRRSGIKGPIIIMNPEKHAFNTLFEHRLEPEVYSFKLLEALVAQGKKQGITDYPIHLKIDTGMHRLGFDPMDTEQLITRLANQQILTPRSIFTHLVGTDSPELDTFTDKQVQLFEQVANQLQNSVHQPILRHVLNSAGIERFPHYQFDLVRLGIGLYGVSATANPSIQPVSTLQTTILQIKELAADQTVGYSRKGTLTRTSRIATLPIGYADGLNRKLGNGKGYVLINHQPAPYIGNICMDVCMVDVTDITCKEGDKATIFGGSLPISILAETLETIPYEILTNVSERVKRVYFQD